MQRSWALRRLRAGRIAGAALLSAASLPPRCFDSAAVSGRRARLTLPRGASEEVAVAAAMADPAVQKFVVPGGVKKTVHVPDKLVSIVV